jgi:hypothetical protein
MTRCGTKHMVQIAYQHSVVQNRGTTINSEQISKIPGPDFVADSRYDFSALLSRAV